MTVYIEKPAVNLREELANLRNQGSYQERQFYFDGLVTNGTFDADTSGWTAARAATLTWVSGAMQISYGGTDYPQAQQTLTTVAGQRYKLQVTQTAGVSLSVVVGTAAGGNQLGSVVGTGSLTLDFVASSTTSYLTLQANSVGSVSVTVDNISVFETDGTDVVHRMPKGWVPLHVYEDGLLQREGAANDYEVVYDGFDYYVKPAVAPSATTQTCVIGVRK